MRRNGWQTNAHDCAVPFVRFDLDATVVCGDDAVADGESESRPGSGGLRSKKGIEKLCSMFRLDACAVVGDLDVKFVCATEEAGGYAQVADFFLVVAHRVARVEEEIKKDLLQAVSVG